MTGKDLQVHYDEGRYDREHGRKDRRRFRRSSSYYLGWTDTDRRIRNHASATASVSEGPGR